MKTISNSLIATALVILLTLLANPFMIWMPSHFQMLVVLIVTLLVVVYGGFVWNEQAEDEREIFHRMLAGRAAFLAAIFILTLALLVQGFMQTIDPWIPAVLALTILAKFIARIWAGHVE